MYKLNNMWFIILFTAIVLLYSSEWTSPNQYLTINTYQMINVNSGDSLWTISSKYVTDKDDIRHLIAAIKHLNQLDNNTQIHPGQILKIPVTSNGITVAKQTK
jgi:LysM repeat protein